MVVATQILIMKNAAIIAILALLTLIFSRLAAGLTPLPSPTGNLSPTPPAAIATQPPSVSPSPAPTIVALPANSEGPVIVGRVIDGDTIELEDKRRVRYIGMNAPELSDSRRQVQCYSQEAARRNQELVEGKEVWLEKDVSEQDQFRRLLRYVYLKDSPAGSAIMVNLALTREGFASMATYPPDVKYQAEIAAAEAEARNANRGLWAACPTR